MTAAEIIYASLTRGLVAVAPLLSPARGKVGRWVAGRRWAVETLATWAAEARSQGELVWFHAASVGEARQAEAVLLALRERRPDVQVAFTYFSPSAETLAPTMPVDVAGYLPWDVSSRVGAALDALRPAALVFTRKEVWPVLTREAAGRRVPMALVAATLRAGSGRASAPARWLLRAAMARLDLVAAVADADAERLVSLGARRDAVRVTGDPAVDAAWERAAAVDRSAAHLAPLFREGRPTLVAGSTWGEDEAVLAAALDGLRKGGSDLRVVLAPHEPSERAVASARSALDRAGFQAGTLSGVVARDDASGLDAVVVDRVGVLAELYAAADVAYVGGGFHGRGLHNVLEPAALGCPTLFGPRHGGSQVAEDLLRAGGAAAVGDATALRAALRRWLADDEARSEAGHAALTYVEGRRGAAVRTAEFLDPLLGEG